jgi:predicted transcriptional regulator
LFQNINGTVTSVISKAEFDSAKSHKFVDENFKGSLPSFIAAFAGGRKFSKKEVDEIQKMIDAFREQVE